MRRLWHAIAAANEPLQRPCAFDAVTACSVLFAFRAWFPAHGRMKHCGG
jgi:hypothetical protein